MKKDLDKMLKSIESIKPQSTYEFRGMPAEEPLTQIKTVKPFYRKKRFVPIMASALAAVIIAAVIVPTVSLNNSTSSGQDVQISPTPDSAYTPIKPNINYKRPPENIINASGLPWENGSLTLTTLSTSKTSGSDIIPLSGHSLRKSQNIDLSFMGNTKILSCSDGNLVKIDTQTGDHSDCNGVYYSIYDRSTMCVACAIKESVRREPYYIDACIRALIEECIFTHDMLRASTVEDKYTSYITMMYEHGVDKVFMRGEMPTAQNTGLDFSNVLIFGEGCEQRVQNYRYPTINVLEFGLSDQYCLYSIASLNSNATWGNFKMNLKTGEVKSLNGDNGDFIANGSVLYNHSINDIDDGKFFAADLHDFASIDISSDYRLAAVTVPYFSSRTEFDYETGMILKTNRKEENVYLFDLEAGEFTLLIASDGNYSPEDLKAKPFPAQPAQIVDGVVCFPTKRDTWYFYYGDACELDGELLKICTLGGIKYAVMLQDENTVYYRLYDGVNVTEDVKTGEISLPEGFTFASNPTSVSISDSAVSVWSKDGKYKYSYIKGDNKILCFETATGTSGQINVPKEFIEKASQTSALKYCLFLNESGTQLILAYYDMGGVWFDRDLYANQEFVNFSGEGFELNDIQLDRILALYYDYEGEGVTFLNEDVVKKSLLVLAYEGMEEFVEQYIKNGLASDGGYDYTSRYDRMLRRTFGEAAEKLAPLLGYDGSNAWLSATSLKAILGDKTLYDYEMMYESLFARLVKK